MPFKITMRTFHLPLPDNLHEALQAEAADEHRPATEILREALEGWLATRRRARLDREIEAYSREMAGTPSDLDPDLEAAGIERLIAGERANCGMAASSSTARSSPAASAPSRPTSWPPSKRG